MKKIFIVMAVFTLLVTGCGCSKKEEKKENKPAEINKDISSFDEQTKDGITVSDLNLNYENGFTQVYATIKNTKSEDVKANDVSIFLYDKDGNKMSEIFCYIGGSLKADKEEICQTAITSNVADAKSFDFKVNE